jgi:ribosomal protein S8
MQKNYSFIESNSLVSISQFDSIRKKNYFIKSIKRRIVVNIYQYIREINQNNQLVSIIFLFLVNKTVVSFVDCLKKYIFIYNYFLTNVFIGLPSLKINKLTQQNLLMLTYLRYSFIYGRPFVKIQLISRPSRLVYLRYTQIIKMFNLNRTNINIFYLIYCVTGLISALELKLLKIGGQVLCRII